MMVVTGGNDDDNYNNDGDDNNYSKNDSNEVNKNKFFTCATSIIQEQSMCKTQETFNRIIIQILCRTSPTAHILIQLFLFFIYLSFLLNKLKLLL